MGCLPHTDAHTHACFGFELVCPQQKHLPIDPLTKLFLSSSCRFRPNILGTVSTQASKAAVALRRADRTPTCHKMLQRLLRVTSERLGVGDDHNDQSVALRFSKVVQKRRRVVLSILCELLSADDAGFGVGRQAAGSAWLDSIRKWLRRMLHRFAADRLSLHHVHACRAGRK